MRHPSWDDVRRFCEVDGWESTHAVRRRKRRDHDRFRKALPDGRVLRTRASHGDAQIGDPSLVNRIIKHQLEVTPEQFWTAVDDGVAPLRTIPGVRSTEEGRPAHSLPDWLAVNLAVNVGLRDEEIAALTEEDALRVWTDWCARR